MSEPHQSELISRDNKSYKGNGGDGKHYWLTPPEVYKMPDGALLLLATILILTCKCPEGFDGLRQSWGQSNYVNPPFGSIIHAGKKKGMTAWVRKAIAEHEEGKTVVMVYPVDKWLLMLLKAGAKVSRTSARGSGSPT